jgi:hypothetical protein
MLKLDISRIMNEIKPGLEVNFFYDRQLFDMLQTYGTVDVIRKTKGKVLHLQRLLILKEVGMISYMVTSQNFKYTK